MPAQPTIDAKELAASYGFAMAVLNSDPSLKKLFNDAVKDGWTGPRFIAELRNTKWFKTHSEVARNAAVLQKTDPATWKQRVQQTSAQVADMAGQLGSALSPKALAAITNNVLSFGWNDAQIRNVLAESVKAGKGGLYKGEAQANADRLRQTAYANGIKLGGLNSWLQNIASGNSSMEEYEAYIREQAASAFPAYAEQIKSGMNVMALAEPYRQAMAQTLELNPGDIDLFDPTMRQALQTTDPKTGQITAKPLWQFEQEMRSDPRWMQTKNAQDSFVGVGTKVLRDMGLVF